MEKAKIITGICDMVITDMENDISESEGQPFTGRNTHILFGKQAAAITALATMMRHIVKELDKED